MKKIFLFIFAILIFIENCVGVGLEVFKPSPKKKSFLEETAICYYLKICGSENNSILVRSVEYGREDYTPIANAKVFVGERLIGNTDSKGMLILDFSIPCNQPSIKIQKEGFDDHISNTETNICDSFTIRNTKQAGGKVVLEGYAHYPQYELDSAYKERACSAVTAYTLLSKTVQVPDPKKFIQDNLYPNTHGLGKNDVASGSKIVDVLKSRGFKNSKLVFGTPAELTKKLVTEIVEKNCAVGIGTYNHPSDVLAHFFTLVGIEGNTENPEPSKIQLIAMEPAFEYKGYRCNPVSRKECNAFLRENKDLSGEYFSPPEFTAGDILANGGFLIVLGKETCLVDNSPVTVPPVVDPPVTVPPVTDPPVTVPPVTDPPVIIPPVADPTPGIVTGFRGVVQNYNTQTRLTWTGANPSGTFYNLQKNSVPIGGQIFATAYTDQVQVANYNQNVNYQIRACNNSGGCGQWVSISVYTPNPTPGTPAYLNASVSAGCYPSTSLSWASTANTEYWVIERRCSVGWCDYREISGRLYSMSYSDYSPDRSQLNYYRVKSCNPIGCSQYRETTVNVGPTKPSIPSGLTLSLASGNSVRASWSFVSNASYYELERSCTTGWCWFQGIGGRLYSTSYTDSYPDRGQMNKYRVRSCDSCGSCSDWSPERTISVP